MQKNTTLKSLT